MFGCHPSLNHYLSRRNRWSWTYACIAITKGLNTLALTRSGPKSVKSFLGLSPKKALPASGFMSRTERRTREGACAQDKLANEPVTCLPHTPCVQEAIPPP